MQNVGSEFAELMGDDRAIWWRLVQVRHDCDVTVSRSFDGICDRLVTSGLDNALFIPQLFPIVLLFDPVEEKKYEL